MTEKGKQIGFAVLVVLLGPILLGYTWGRLIESLEIVFKLRGILGVAFLLGWWKASVHFRRELGGISHALFLGVPVLMFLLNLIPNAMTPSVINVFWQSYFLPPMWVTATILNLIMPSSVVGYMWMYHLASVVLLAAFYLLAIRFSAPKEEVAQSQ